MILYAYVVKKYIMELSYFNTNSNYYDSLNQFFSDLKLPFENFGRTKPFLAKDFFTKSNNKTLEIAEFVYPLGEVNEDAFLGNSNSMFKKNFVKSQTEGIVLLGISLNKECPTKSELNAIARACNREFDDSPVVVIFKYKKCISIANCERSNYAKNQQWREGQKVGKVSLLKDINLDKIHAGHERILSELTNIKSFKDIRSFVDLHKYWQSVFDTSILNNRFYKDIANWFFWAVENVKFPTDAYKEKENPQEVANQIAVIRLLTRFIFVWFIKEKSLVKEELFDYNYLKDNILKFKDKNKTIYYKTILQNLFFATLNTEMNSKNRSFSFQDNSSFLVAKYRYKEYFKNPEQNVKELFADVPFLNGGLFDFLDKENPKDAKNPIRVDWFSDPDPKDKNYRENKLKVPDFLFFGEELDESDLLNSIYDTKKQTYKVKGLIPILNSYKFTVEENTPIDIEVALDPELLGKVFENLLAYYNPETGKTARKNLGAFYTPREIVNYMVDESLKAYLKTQLPDLEIDEKLNQLIEYNELDNPFDKETTIHLISALNSIKVLDPACGSGAFPMGVLQKIVYILSKLDHDNQLWKQEQKEKVIGEKITELLNDKEQLKNLSDKQLRERAEKEADKRIQEIETEFDNEFRNPDYLRKLFIIQDAIYGVDIQPIAVQISKLRFFLSLIIEQNGNPKEYNRGYVPLPNLETKFVSANTLIGLDKQSNTFKSPQVAQLETEIKEIRQRHFFAKDRKQKREIQKQDETKRKQLETQLKKDGWPSKQAEQLSAWNPYDQNQTAEFFDVEWMFGINEGFDILIGNPPYFNIQTLGAKSEYVKKIQNRYSEIWMDKSDILFYFIKLGIDIANKNANISYIISNAFLFSDKAQRLRNYIISNASIQKIINFEKYLVFENAMITTAMVFFKKGTNNNTTNALVLKDDSPADFVSYISNENNFFELKLKSGNVFALVTNSIEAINTKIDFNKSPLGSLVLVGKGMETAANEVFSNEEIRKKGFPDMFLKKRLNGKAIKKYNINQAVAF